MAEIDQSKKEPAHFEEIRTRVQALGYLRELISGLATARHQLDEAQLVIAKQRAFHNLLIRYGRALGAVTTLRHTRHLEAEDYQHLAPEIHAQIVPSTVILGG